MRISFGPFAFDPQSRLLWRDGAEIALPPRVLGVLEVLIERAGQVVARQDLLDRVWKDAFVTDTSLAEAVSFLRQALGDDPQSPRYIQTVHRRGYRFLVTPEPAEAAPRTVSTAAISPRADAARGDWRLVPWISATLCAGLAAAAVWHDTARRPPDPPPVARLELHTTPGTTFDREPGAIAVSPDGRSLAWSACDTAGGRCTIYVRALDRLAAQPLAGTDGGHSPVFSPDGRWIAFFADGALKKIATAGGTATALAAAPNPSGAAWGTDGRIVFAASAASGLSAVGGEGGTPQTLTRPDAATGDLRHRFPAWVGGAGLVFTIASDPDADAAGTLAALAPDAGTVRARRAGVHRAAPAGRSYLLLAAGGDLQAATFDDRTLALTGSSDAVATPPGGGRVEFAVGGDTLAVVRTDARGQFAWDDGAGIPALSRISSIALAPDARRAAGVDAGGDVWIVDLASGARDRVTFGGGSASPAWSADGSRLAYATRTGGGPFRVVSRPVTDRATPDPMAGAPPQAFPSSIAGDGRIALTVFHDGHTSVAVLTPEPAALRTLTDGPFDEAAATFSPDGRWLALESSASGRVDVVIRSAADGRRVAIVSPDGGARPSWSADGSAVYFQSGDRLMKRAFAAEMLRPPGVVHDRPGERVAAVAPSGRLLIERRPAADTAVVALQWLRELRERLPLPVNTPR